ncbi:hypothetical protein COB55_05085, partial [Candidatus Wolfebacteria bacterium]
MKKIIITESQFKRLVENIIMKDYNPFNDPKAEILVDFINDKTNIEVGIQDVDFDGDVGYMKRYFIKGYPSSIIIGTDDEFNKLYSKSDPYYDVYDIEKYNG